MKRILILLAWIAYTTCAAQSVVFISPGHSTEAYWRTAAQAMKAVASSLGMRLEVASMERDHTRNVSFVRDLIARPPAARPDYVVLSNDYSMATTLLPMLDQAGIKTFLAFSGILTAAEWHKVGEPRDIYHHWIGSIEPLAEEIGYTTARDLIDIGRQRKLFAPDGKLHLFALAGDRSTPSSILRTQGMRRAVDEVGDVVLEQVVTANWNRAKAREKSDWLFARYPDARLVWSANDLMAFGAMDSLEYRGGRPGQDVVFSAVNTSPAAMEAIDNGRLAVLSGGHFIAGAWALVMIYDYHHGRDFADEGLSLRRSMAILFSQKDARRFSERFGNDRFDIDFRSFSKVLNPARREYDFSFRRLLDQRPSPPTP